MNGLGNNVSKSEQNRVLLKGKNRGFAERGTSYTNLRAFSGNKWPGSLKGLHEWKPLHV